MPPAGDSSDPSTLIPSSKSAFLTTQIRLLSSPLTLPVSILSASSSASTTTIPQQTTDKLLTQVNKRLASHTRLAFPLQSQRHVVEQIDTLYWREVLSKGLPVRPNETVIKRDVDLTESAGVRGGLGEQWEDVVLDQRPAKRRRVDSQRQIQSSNRQDRTSEQLEEDHGDELQAEQYRDRREMLLAQIERRDQLRRKLAQYKKLQDLLRPFEDPLQNIQPNLMTRDTKEAVDAELARMRVLLARVGTKVQERAGQSREERKEEILETTNEAKLEFVLGLG